MGFLLTVLAVVVGLLGSLLILRAYLWSLAISPRDPLVRFAWKLTDWLVNPVAISAIVPELRALVKLMMQ